MPFSKILDDLEDLRNLDLSEKEGRSELKHLRARAAEFYCRLADRGTPGLWRVGPPRNANDGVLEVLFSQIETFHQARATGLAGHDESFERASDGVREYSGAPVSWKLQARRLRKFLRRLQEIATDGRRREDRQQSEVPTLSQPKRRGRPPASKDEVARDERILSVWEAGRHKGTYASLARELGLSKSDIKKAIDRAKKRPKK